MLLSLFRGHSWAQRATPAAPFEPVAEPSDAVLRHLAGDAQIAVEPLQADGTTWMTALGLHNRASRTWKTDVVLLGRAAADLGIPLYVERTRTGQGVHAWIFFCEPVPAADARRLGAALLVAASTDGTPLKSFERVAPGDDPTTPAPIALPLQGRAMQEGNTVFIEPVRGLPAVRDQWALVASIRCMSAADVHHKLRQITGQGCGGRLPEPAPSEVAGVLSARLAVRRPLPAGLAHRLRRRLVQPNPEYARRKAASLSLKGIPRLLPAFERREGAWLLPAGALPEIEAWCASEGMPWIQRDARYAHPAEPRGQARGLGEQQQVALEAVLRADAGVLEAAEGMGRSIVGLAAAAARGVPTLVAVANAARLQQWREEAILWLGLEDEEIGTLADVETRPGAFLTLAGYAAVAARPMPALESRFGFVILDDCRRASAAQVTDLLHAVPAPHRLGLNDLSPRSDGLDEWMERYLGPVVHRMGGHTELLLDVILRPTMFAWEEPVGAGPAEEADAGGDALFEMEETAPVEEARRDAPHRAREWAALLEALASDARRNALVVRDVVAEARSGQACLVYTARRDHAQSLAEQIGREVPVAVAVGNASVPQRREALRRFRDGEANVIVVTEQLASTALEVPHLSRVFLVFPLRSESLLRQCLARLTRPAAGKTSARVYDYLDEHVPRLETMARARRRFYRREHTTLNADATQLRLPFE